MRFVKWLAATPTSLIKQIIAKIGMLLGIIIWGLILWTDMPDQLSYMSILYGMAVQFWICCVGGIVLGLSGKRCVVCTRTHCAHDNDVPIPIDISNIKIKNKK